MKRTVAWILTANLLAIAVLVFTYPQFMISPGKLIEAHRAIETDCFTCHQAFMGLSSIKCIACHKLAEIGVKTTQGMPVLDRKIKSSFHQRLIEQDCIACHSDHQGVMKYRAGARFSHNLLEPSLRNQCESCHEKPSGSLHRQIAANCSQCHSQDRWKPATFDHDQYFVLDENHNTTCATCHIGNDFQKYSCYGCHAHTPGGIRSKHLEEGIRNFQNCVECHRSGNREGAKGERAGEGD